MLSYGAVLIAIRIVHHSLSEKKLQAVGDEEKLASPVPILFYNAFENGYMRKNADNFIKNLPHSLEDRPWRRQSMHTV